MTIVTRRGVLAGLGAMLGPTMAGCAGELGQKLPDSDPATPLTIDVHSHVFNGSDVQIRDFIKYTHPDEAAFADLLDELGAFAPTADKELAELGAASIPVISLPLASDMGERQYQVAKQRIAKAHADAIRTHRSKSVRMTEARDQITDKLNALPATYAGYKAKRRADRQVRLHAANMRSAPPGATPTVAPVAVRSLASPCGGASTTEGSNLDGLFDFLMRNFHYRYVNVHDYITEYSTGPLRKIDLMTTQIIDYDWPLGDLTTPSSLREQVMVMERIMRLTNGRILNFAPFCPFKQAAFFRGIPGVDNPIDIVQDAVLNRGHVGVKIYPPMGFLPYGNAGLGPTYWGDDTPVRKELRGPTLGAELDAALDVLYAWCLDNDVPVMAHTSPGNAAACKYLTDIMPPRGWQAVVQRYPGLRVNFAHFGHTDIVSNGGANASVLMAYMSAGDTSGGRNLYADSAYFAEVLTDRQKVDEQLRKLFVATAAKGEAALSRRLMYGTDWEMVIMEGGTTAYLELFEEVMADLSQDSTISPHRDLADRFFGLNAASYLGLRPGDANRARLDAFFGSAKPAWMKKVDKVASKLRA
jgi:predicted TIM-barrel fold metal-dependent hydrolase